MRKFFKLFVRDERGVSALEYAILAGLVIAAVVAGLSTFSTTLRTAFTNLSTQVQNATASATGSGSGSGSSSSGNGNSQ